MKLNQTPVRTARNFGINNIEIGDFEINKETPEFEGVKVTGLASSSRLDFI